MPWVCNKSHNITQCLLQVSLRPNIQAETYRIHSVYDHISDLHPSLQRQHLKESQHGIADIVKVEVARVCPGNTHNQEWVKGEHKPESKFQEVQIPNLV